MLQAIFVPDVEAFASVLGFIPTHYPAGVVLAEVYSTDLDGIVMVTGRVENIDTAEKLDSVLVWPGRTQMEDSLRSLFVRAGGRPA